MDGNNESEINNSNNVLNEDDTETELLALQKPVVTGVSGELTKVHLLLSAETHFSQGAAKDCGM